MLRAAFSEDRTEAAHALAEWRNDIADFDEVHGTDSTLFPQIYRNLGSEIPDAALAARLKGALLHQWVRNNYMLQTASKVLRLLGGHGIPVLLIKGAAIATAFEAGGGVRTLADCDLLVQRDRAITALDVLLSSGLFEPARLAPQDLDLAHGLTLRRLEFPHLDLIDLHWRPLRTVGADALAEEMFRAASEVSLAGCPCLVPAPEHLLFHCIVHGTDWSPSPRYEWLVDTVRILKGAGAAFDWGRLEGIARRYRYRFLVSAALDEAQRTIGIAIPAEVRKRLAPGLAPVERREARLQRARPSSLSAVDELLLALQRRRRASPTDLKRPVWRAFPGLSKSLLGIPAAPELSALGSVRERVRLVHGWSAPEVAGHWTEGRFASLIAYSLKPYPSSLKLRARPLRGENGPAQTVDVFAGLRRVGSFVWSASGPDPYAQAVPLPQRLWRGDVTMLRFHIGSRVMPAEIGVGHDTRLLGILVEEISVDPPVFDLGAGALELGKAACHRDALWHGWSAPEDAGCWTFGNRSVLRWRSRPRIDRGARIVVEIAGVAPGRDELSGRFRLNDTVVGRFVYPAADAMETRVALPLDEAISAGAEMELAIEVDRPRTPAETIGTEDRRPLGLFVRRVWIERAGSM